MTEELAEDREQILQEDEYVFPYHHIAQRRDGFSQCFNDTWGINYLATIDFLLEQLRAETFSSVVDIGCGDGRFSRELMDAFPETRVTGVDFSRKAITLARAMVPHGDFRDVDITSAHLDETFDLGVLMEVFEHIPPPEAPRFVAGVARLLRPGGILYVTVPHLNKAVEPKHYRHFSVASLAREFEKDFEVLRVVPIETISVLNGLMTACLSNPLFVLNSRRIGGWIYAFYKRRLFLAGHEERCQRLILRMRRR